MEGAAAGVRTSVRWGSRGQVGHSEGTAAGWVPVRRSREGALSVCSFLTL